MTRKLITEQYLRDIADAIRAKRKVARTFAPPQMAAGILGIELGRCARTAQTSGLDLDFTFSAAVTEAVEE